MSDTYPQQSLSYRRRLSLAWTPLAAVPDAAECERLGDEALRVLNAVAVLESHRARSDEPEPLELEVERLHLKLDVLIELVGAALAGRDGNPPPLMVELSAQGLAWQQPAPPPVDSHGLVALHLHRCVPQPLRLAVRIRQIDGDLVQADFLPLSEAGQAALERHVFLHHRRQIAESRQAVRTGG